MEHARVCSVSEMRVIEVNAEWLGVTASLMMENAGAAVAREVSRRAPRGSRVAVVCGAGGKAGDGMVAARHLEAMGYRVSVLLVEPRIKHPSAISNYNIVKRLLGIHVVEYYYKWLDGLAEYDVIVDAMLGTGFRPPLREPYLSIVKRCNSVEALKVAVDIPTGVDPDTGAVEPEAFHADVTVTMHCVKRGLLREPGRSYAGEVVVAHIGVPREAELVIGPGVLGLIAPFPPRGHKGVNGRILVVGGSEEYHGAPWLTALAALEAGADLVYLAAPEVVVSDAFSPEVIPVMLPSSHLEPGALQILRPLLGRVDVVVIGPGLGRRGETVEAVAEIIEASMGAGKSLVVDADAIYALAETKTRLGCSAVLTPHLGEASRLLGKRVDDTLDARIAAALDIAATYNAVTLLKGWVDIVASPSGAYKVNITGSPQMTVGGTGDVLAGVVAALMCRADPYTAACAAAYAVGKAGELAEAEEARVTPIRVLRRVARVLQARA